MNYTREQLMEMARFYFNKTEQSAILCTADGNFFYDNAQGRNDCSSHAKLCNIAQFKIGRYEKIEEPKKTSVADVKFEKYPAKAKQGKKTNLK